VQIGEHEGLAPPGRERIDGLSNGSIERRIGKLRRWHRMRSLRLKSQRAESPYSLLAKLVHGEVVEDLVGI
jgi:hypothetical protein